jgi:hypothetical protein
MAHQARHMCRLSQVDGVTSPRHERSHGARGEADQAQRVARETDVVGSGQREHRGSQGSETLPQGHLGTCSTQTQTRGKTGCAVTEAFRLVGCTSFGQAVEHRAAEPALDECGDVTRRLEAIRHGVIRGTSLRSQAFVLNAGRRSDQHQMADAQVGLECDVQSGPGSERITQQIARSVPDDVTHRLGDQRSRSRQVSAHGVRTGMTRQVDGHDAEVLFQLLAECAPESPRLSEAVQQHQGPTRAAYLDMEWHAG